MNNDAGWCGSGGPWITPELAMQKVVWTETPVEGPQRFEGPLAQPKAVAGYYRDIAVLAFPTPAGKARIENIEGKSALAPTVHPRPQPVAFGPGRCRRFAAIGSWTSTAKLRRRRPADLGRARRASWTMLRLGHTTTGKDNHPAPAGRPRPGVRQAQPGGDRGPVRRPDGQADRRRRARWPARRWSPRTSTVGRSARRTGRRGSARSSSGGAATTCCRCCR